MTDHIEFILRHFEMSQLVTELEHVKTLPKMTQERFDAEHKLLETLTGRRYSKAFFVACVSETIEHALAVVRAVSISSRRPESIELLRAAVIRAARRWPVEMDLRDGKITQEQAGEKIDRIYKEFSRKFPHDFTAFIDVR